jgi:hypothetical protein
MISVPDEARLKIRIQELHAAVAANDAQTWYAMMPPYLRKTIKFEDFKTDMGLNHSREEKMRLNFEKLCYPCTVIGERIRCGVTAKAESKGRKALISELWEYVDGEWYWAIFGEWGCEDQ